MQSVQSYNMQLTVTKQSVEGILLLSFLLIFGRSGAFVEGWQKLCREGGGGGVHRTGSESSLN